ncbi:MAG: MBL fold metallo-hydrolase, partial [Tardiphaga sp.]
MAASHLALTLIGGPTVLIELGGLRLLTDPTFDPPGLYRETPVRFEKTSGPALSVEQIGALDAVLLSHDHHLDNLDSAGRMMLPSVGVSYTTLAGAARLGGN